MSLLLDSHAYLWWATGDPRLSALARSMIEDAEQDVALSAATVWEIGIKRALGKLSLGAPLQHLLVEEPRRRGLTMLPVTHAHAARASELPMIHRDPFDRMLVAQAELEGRSLVTRDRRLTEYGVQIVW